ncbi:uncharacterized protein [Dermacentor andersoni]|uniref:uncharacterized protein n=1 Tax=Dermacentor andersoni TaxID=34620 RepID=UPI003B3B9202
MEKGETQGKRLKLAKLDPYTGDRVKVKMASAGVLFLVAAALCAAAVAAAEEPKRPQDPGLYPHPHPCLYRCTLRGCDQFQCHYNCVRGASCPLLGDSGTGKGGAEVTVSKPLSEKVDAFDYVPE